MRLSILLAVTLIAPVGVCLARGTNATPEAVFGTRIGAMVDLCPNLINLDMQQIVDELKPDDFDRWLKKNEFDGAWRAQVEKDATAAIHQRIDRYYSPGKQYTMTTWLALGPYDFKASEFPLLIDNYVDIGPHKILPTLRATEAEYTPALKQNAIFQHLFMPFASPRNQALRASLTSLGLSINAPQYMRITLPVGLAGHGPGLVHCSQSAGDCLQVPESQARSIVDSKANPGRYVHVTMHVRFTSCTPEKNAAPNIPNYTMYGELTYLAFEATSIHSRFGVLSKLMVSGQDDNKYSVDDVLWKWNAPSANAATSDSPSSRQ